MGNELPDHQFEGILQCPHCDGRMYGCILTKKYGWVLACIGGECRKIVTRVQFPDEEGTAWEPIWVGKNADLTGMEGLE